MRIYESGNILKSRKAVMIINAFAGLLLIIAILFFIRDIVAVVVPSGGTVPDTAKKSPGVVRHNLQDYAAILRDNPFGFPAGELRPLSPAAGPSVSEADISLIGTISGRRDLSYAIFADKTGQQDVFKTGDKVFGLGILSKVGISKVVINANGRDIEVPLTDLAVVKEIKSGAVSTPGLGKKTGESTYLVDPQRLQQAIERPEQIMTDARFIPNIMEGRQQGFVLREVKPGGIYQGLGLQNGDVLLRINEYAISNPESALQAFTALRGIDRAQLDIIRNGAKMTMTYQIR